MTAWLVAAVILVALVVLALAAYRPLVAVRREAVLSRARREFRQQRERLEMQFFKLASTTGKPRGLRWSDCDFENPVEYARDRRSGQLSAFVACTISFEAIEGGPMEGVEAVGNLRAATAVFNYTPAGWTTAGRVMFNLNPREAIAFYQGTVEAAGAEGPNQL